MAGPQTIVKGAKNATVGYKGVFEGLDFPPYEYQHYPLMMSKGEGKEVETVIVEDEEEEAAQKELGFVSPNVGPPVHVTQTQYDDMTQQIAALQAENARLREGSTPPPPQAPNKLAAAGGVLAAAAASGKAPPK